MELIEWVHQNPTECLAIVSTLISLAVAVTSLWSFKESIREKSREQAYKVAAWWVRVDSKASIEFNGKDFDSTHLASARQKYTMQEKCTCISRGIRLNKYQMLLSKQSILYT